MRWLAFLWGRLSSMRAAPRIERCDGSHLRSTRVCMMSSGVLRNCGAKFLKHREAPTYSVYARCGALCETSNWRCSTTFDLANPNPILGTCLKGALKPSRALRNGPRGIEKGFERSPRLVSQRRTRPQAFRATGAGCALWYTDVHNFKGYYARLKGLAGV